MLIFIDASTFPNFVCWFIDYHTQTHTLYLPLLRVYRGLFISTRFISFSQYIFGGGFPVARHCIIAEWPISITLVLGLWVITGKPIGVLSAETDKQNDVVNI